MRPQSPLQTQKPDDGTVYHYCSVQVQGTRRPYAYLTGGLPLKVGDWVELPFGKSDVRAGMGRVKSRYGLYAHGRALARADKNVIAR